MLLNCGVEEDSWESLDCKEIQPVHTKRNQSWIFIERTDAEAETSIRWPPDEKNWLIRKDPDAGKDWRQEEKETIADKMVGWHHWLNEHAFEQALVMNREAWHAAVHGVTKSWTRLSDWTELNWTELKSDEYFNYFEEQVGISRSWITSHFQSFPASGVFSSKSVPCIRRPKYWSFSFSIDPSNEYSGLISFRMDWLDLLAVKRLSRVFSNTTVQKHKSFAAPLSL